MEHPDRWGGVVDLPTALDERSAERVRAVLLGDAGEDQVAVRPSGIYVRRLVRAARVDPVVRSPQRESRRPRGTVLITGGTGALGGQIARWFAGKGAEHLLLVSRRGEDAPGSAELKAELAAAGVPTTIAACDVADRDALAQLIVQAAAAGSPVRSVVHAAGVGASEALAETSLEAFAGVVRAKIAGAVNLDTLLDGEALDDFVLFSSISGIWGSGGQSAYSSANAYLDALAESRRGRGQVATSISWGPWAGGGMAADDGRAAGLRRRGLPALDPDAALASLELALDGDDTCVTIADVGWDTFTPIFTAARRSALLEGVPEAGAAMAAAAADQTGSVSRSDGADALRERLAALSGVDRDEALLDLIRTQAGVALGHASPGAVEVSRSFSALGFDSLTAVDFRTGLAAATGLRLPTTLVFDHPTPADLLRHLRAELLPDEAATLGERFLAELERLDAASVAEGANNLVRTKVTMRLQSLLDAWSAPAAARGTASVVDALDSASDDELFEFINRDLGR